jgi:drug/metabolite transporter (DMT)-like permease
MSAAIRTRYPILLLGAVAIGVAPLFVRWIHVTYGVGPTAIACWRMALSWPVFAVALATAARPVDTERARPAGMALVGALFVLDLALWHTSLVRTSIANSTLLSNLAPIFVALGGWLLFGARVGRSFIAAMVLALAGGVCLTGASIELGGTHLPGDGLAAAAAVAYAAYLLALARVRRDASTLRLMTWSGAVAALGFAAVAWALGERFVPNAPSGWLALGAFAVVAQLCGQALVAYSLDTVPATVAAVTLLIQPVLATLLAWPLFAEPIGLLQGVGAMMVMGGIVWARRDRARPEAPANGGARPVGPADRDGPEPRR